jgi:rhomboid protease GluP
MAFGFSPQYIQEFQLEDQEADKFLIIALEAANRLGWNVGFVSETGYIAYTNFSMTSWSEEVTVMIGNGTASIKSQCNGSQFFDWGKNKKNVEQFLSAFEKAKNEISPDEIKSKLQELKPGFAANEDNILNRPPSTTKEKITSVFSIFIPVKGYFVTPLLVDINIILFIAMVASGVNFFSPDTESLLKWGANFRPMTLEGQSWRLLTACFLHIGIFHLLFNMYALIYIGLLLEPYLGTTRFTAAYLLTGIASSVCSLGWNYLIISAGASGAIFGLYGVFFAMLTTNLLDKSVKKAFLLSIGLFIAYNLLNGLKPNSGIDNAAHIGGLISGFILGYALVPSLKDLDSARLKWITVGALAVFVLAVSFTIYRNLPNDIAKYDKEMQKFSSMEAKALEVYSLPEGTPNEIMMAGFKEKGIYYWNENLKLLESFKDLDLPLPIRARNTKLKEYCELRIKTYELIYETLQGDYELDMSQINVYNQQIQQLLEELNKQ